MRTLVFLSAVLAAAVARSGVRGAGQLSTSGAASTRMRTARGNSVATQENSTNNISAAQTDKPLLSPVKDYPKTSSPVNAKSSNSFTNDFPVGQIVDNPHTGLSFGTVLPLPSSLSPSASTTMVQTDKPQVGLPANSPSPDLPADRPVSLPVNSDNGFSSSLPFRPVTNVLGTVFLHGYIPRHFLTDNSQVRLPANSPSPDLPVNSPASFPVNSGNSFFESLSDRPISNVLGTVSSHSYIPTTFPTGNTNVNSPVSNSLSQHQGWIGLPIKKWPVNLPTDNAIIDASVNHPFHDSFPRAVNPKLPYKTTFPYSSHAYAPKFMYHFPAKSVTPSMRYTPIRPSHFGLSIGSPIYPHTNAAFAINDQSLTSNPHSNLLVNSANVLLFGNPNPSVNVVNTPQGAVLVGGPANFAIFSQHPSVDDINQVLAANAAPFTAAAAHFAVPVHTHVVAPAWGPPSAGSPPDTMSFAGVPVRL